MTEKEQHNFELLLEDIKHSVEAIAEGHGALDDKMERFHKEAKEDHRLAMDLIKYSHDELKKEIRVVDKRSEARDVALTAELKVEIQAVDKRSEARDAALTAELKKEIRAVDKRSEARDAALTAELKKEIRAVDKRSEARDAALTEELKKEIQAVDKRSEARDAALTEELKKEIQAVGQKACLCVDARRQVDGHESRILFLERKAA